MKTKLLGIVIITSFLLVTGISLGAEIDTVILTNDAGSIDNGVAQAAGNKEGIPVFSTSDQKLTDDLKSKLEAMNVTTVIIVGGPEALPEAIETKLENLGFDVVRLWGISRVGTALEVAEYFWPEEAECSVIVQSERGKVNHTEELKASNLAQVKDCPLIPIPQGKVPAKVLSKLNNLNTSNVSIIGKVEERVKERFKGFGRKFVEDVDKEILEELEREGKESKLVVVSSPSWKQSLGVGAHPNENSVVKMISSMNETDELITYINESNFTEIKVVGVPWLAQKVADKLREAGIEVDKVSGEHASEIALEMFEKVRERWKEKRAEFLEKWEERKEEIKEKLEERLNSTKEELEELKLELEVKENVSKEKVNSLKARIEVLKGKFDGIKSNIHAGKLSEARQAMFGGLSEVMSQRWKNREKIKFKWKEELEEETGELEEVEIEPEIEIKKEKCINTTQLENLIAKAKSLKENATQAKEEGDYTRASKLLLEVRDLVKSAKNLGNVCGKRGKIPEKFKNITEEKVKETEEAREKAKEMREEWKEKLEEIKEETEERKGKGAGVTVNIS